MTEIGTKRKALPSAAVWYGVSGIGKTSLAAHIPGVAFVVDAQELGVLTLMDNGLIPEVPVFPAVTSAGECLELLEELRVGDHQYRALAMDAMGGFEALFQTELCRRAFGGDWGEHGFMGYKRGFDMMPVEWRALLMACDRLRHEREMSVVLLGHSKVSPFKNPEGPDYDRFNADVHEKVWAVTERWADMILFCNYEVSFASKDANKPKAKAMGGRTRMMYAQKTVAYDAKNRHGLPEEIEMGDSGAEAWNNLSAALKAGRKAVAA